MAFEIASFFWDGKYKKEPGLSEVKHKEIYGGYICIGAENTKKVQLYFLYAATNQVNGFGFYRDYGSYIKAMRTFGVNLTSMNDFVPVEGANYKLFQNILVQQPERMINTSERSIRQNEILQFESILIQYIIRVGGHDCSPEFKRAIIEMAMTEFDYTNWVNWKPIFKEMGLVFSKEYQHHQDNQSDILSEDDLQALQDMFNSEIKLSSPLKGMFS